MVVLGTDAHTGSHTVVAVDEAGAEIGSVTVGATPEGHLRLVKWAARRYERVWGGTNRAAPIADNMCGYSDCRGLARCHSVRRGSLLASCRATPGSPGRLGTNEALDLGFLGGAGDKRVHGRRRQLD